MFIKAATAQAHTTGSLADMTTSSEYYNSFTEYSVLHDIPIPIFPMILSCHPILTLSDAILSVAIRG